MGELDGGGNTREREEKTEEHGVLEKNMKLVQVETINLNIKKLQLCNQTRGKRDYGRTGHNGVASWLRTAWPGTAPVGVDNTKKNGRTQNQGGKHGGTEDGIRHGERNTGRHRRQEQWSGTKNTQGKREGISQKSPE